MGRDSGLESLHGIQQQYSPFQTSAPRRHHSKSALFSSHDDCGDLLQHRSTLTPVPVYTCTSEALDTLMMLEPQHHPQGPQCPATQVQA